MSVQTELNTLKQNLQTAKDAIATNLTSKGVTTEPTATLTNMAENVNNIPSGGGDLGFSEIGYSDIPKTIESDIAYSKEWAKTWDASATRLMLKDDEMVYFPYVDTSNITQIYFNQCKNLKYIPDNLNISNVTNMIFNTLNLEKLPNWDYSKVQRLNFNSFTCKEFPPTIDISSCTKLNFMKSYDNTGALNDFIHSLDTSKMTDFDNTFKETQFRKIKQDSITTNEKFNFKNATNMYSSFEDCVVRTITFQEGETAKVEDFRYCFERCNATVDNLDFSSVINMTDMFTKSLCTLYIIKNIGKSSLEEYNFLGVNYWYNKDMFNSLYTYSYDRATNGMPVAKIILPSEILTTLTAEEIQQIESKGYKVVDELGDTFDKINNEINTKINDIKTLI